MGKDIDHRLPHHRRQTYCRAEIVGEYKECATKNPEPTSKADPIHNCSHSVFTNAKIEIAPGEIPCLDAAAAFYVSVVRRCQICRAANQIWNFLGEGIDRLSTHSPSGNLISNLVFWHFFSQILRQLLFKCLIPLLGQIRVLLSPFIIEPGPFVLQ